MSPTIRRVALAFAIGALLLSTTRLADAAPVTAGDHAKATLTQARAHGTPATPLVALVSISAGLASILLWRSVVPSTPGRVYATPRSPIRRRGPPSSRAD